MRKNRHHSGEVGVCVGRMPRAAERTVAAVGWKGGIERQRRCYLQNNQRGQKSYQDVLKLTQLTERLRNLWSVC